MKIIVTGASGQYGSQAVRLLLERIPPKDLILITRRPEKLSAFAARGAIVRQADFDQPASLQAAFAGGERMLLISGTRVGKRVVQHKAAIEAAVAAGVAHVVYTSFIGLHPQNPAVIVHDHAPTEAMLRDSGLAWTALRDAQYAEAVAGVMAPNAIASGCWRSSAGAGRMAFVSREDCVACAVAVLTGEGHENRVYDITGPELLTFRQAAMQAAEIAGVPIPYDDVDDDAMYAMFDSMGIPREPVDDLIVGRTPWNSDDMVTFEAAMRGGWFAILSNDVEQLIGRKPASLHEVLRRHIEVLRQAAAERVSA